MNLPWTKATILQIFRTGRRTKGRSAPHALGAEIDDVPVQRQLRQRVRISFHLGGSRGSSSHPMPFAAETEKKSSSHLANGSVIFVEGMSLRTPTQF